MFYCDNQGHASHVSIVKGAATAAMLTMFVSSRMRIFSHNTCAKMSPFLLDTVAKVPKTHTKKKRWKDANQPLGWCPKSRIALDSWISHDISPLQNPISHTKISYNLIVPKLEFHIWFITYQEWLLNNLNSDISNVFQCCSTHTWSSWPQNKNSGASPVLHDLGSWVAE